MKRAVALLLTCVFVVGCGRTDLASKNAIDHTNNNIVNGEGLIEERDNYIDAKTEKHVKSNKEEFFGKWKIVSMTGSGYIFPITFNENDYIGCELLIDEDYFEMSGNGLSVSINNPIYKKKKVSDKVLYTERKIKKKTFGINKKDVVKKDTLYDKDKEQAFVGASFYVKDKDSLIIIGPIFLLAERIE